MRLTESPEVSDILKKHSAAISLRNISKTLKNAHIHYNTAVNKCHVFSLYSYNFFAY